MNKNKIARFIAISPSGKSMNILLVHNRTEYIDKQNTSDIIVSKEAPLGSAFLEKWLPYKNGPINVNGHEYIIKLIKRYDESTLRNYEPPREIDFSELQRHKVHVYRNICGCEKHYHDIEYVSALVSERDRGQDRIVIQHCLECPEDKYFINTAKLMAYNKKFGYIPLYFVHDGTGKGNYDSYGRAEVSLLAANGYSTHLAEEHRCDIISYVINTGIMSKQQVINLLESLIATNGRNPVNASAKKAWQYDLIYTLEFNVPQRPKILAELR